MININNFTQGIYDSVPFTTIDLPDMAENTELIHDIIDAMPKPLISMTYIAQDDSAIINLIFHTPTYNVYLKEINQDLNTIFEGGIKDITRKVIGDHTYITCEIIF